jgi:hypothetical protein
MISTLYPLLLNLRKAPLNTTAELLGFDSLMGPGRALVFMMYLLNIAVIHLICKLAADGQTELSDVTYSAILIQFGGILFSEVGGKFIGILSIIPIFLVTVLLFMRICGLPLRKANVVTTLYYAWQACSLLFLRMLILK